MAMDEILLAKISEILALKGTLCIDEKDYTLEQFSVTKSKIPVRRPTTRGGVYFTDTTAYKVKAITHDLSIIEKIPQLMLGPNSDFKPIQIKANLELDGLNGRITLIAHLTSAMNSKTMVELNLIVDKVTLE
jgi:hypothetical protein